MSANTFIDNAKVMAKGQITIPKDVREVLGVTSGDRVTFIVEGNTVRIVNSLSTLCRCFKTKWPEKQNVPV